MKFLTVFSTQGTAPAQEDTVLNKKEKGLFVIADAFGGQTLGVEASQTACESILHFLEKEAGDLDATMPFVLRSYYSLAGNVLFNAILHANKMVLKKNKDKGLQEMAGASVLAAYLDGNLFALANAGVCSAWLMRGQTMKELVTPRSYGRLVNPLEMDADEYSAVPLTALGMSEDLEPEIIEFHVQEGDIVVLQTDGIHQQARDAVMNCNGDFDSLQKTLSELNYSDNASLSVISF